MTLAIALTLFGLLLMYAGVKGDSIRSLLVGRVSASQTPAAVTR